ncbi:MAG: TRAP transporter large permease subunit, partial [Bradyrhizobium sp.]
KVLAPVVGPDAALIWFGVMLCVNMQTSFLHPPFGFALFYLRGVAPKEVKSSDIYWGAMPWIGLQAIMVALVIAFPVVVTGLLDKPLDVDLNKVKIEVPQIEFQTAYVESLARIASQLGAKVVRIFGAYEIE